MKKAVLLVLCIIIVFSYTSYIYGDNASNDVKKPAFTDIKGHWAEVAIDKMAKLGIVNGVGNDCFEPDSNMTRGQFAGLLHKALGLQINYFRACLINEVYKDVTNESWYGGMLYDLVTTGIVDDKAAFRPENYITREELAHYIVKAYEYKKVTLVNYSAEAENFKDKSEINPSFAGDAGKAVKLKLLTGNEDNMLRPKASSTRAEVTVVIDRLLNALNESKE